MTKNAAAPTTVIPVNGASIRHIKPHKYISPLKLITISFLFRKDLTCPLTTVIPLVPTVKHFLESCALILSVSRLQTADRSFLARLPMVTLVHHPPHFVVQLALFALTSLQFSFAF